ncbi:uncharacterized protein LOC116032674 isoform X3 [Ipomoea triloba]|uniref:uncharacterized protein LOC116032674 isoform X3 n=1 Tax=Ipomoea triloba TaxID=35885 RepID=UPI00125DC655|nr:uncharacterized protein LOC116032674 isoform X3 [Ipomoea triloba]XP_031131214.1 uncharacterized protein LOC116032674 isoform X3 [Ipomoea triloba]XP_031131215.1 uncharacterized protein LOC116032674 isoform X3 [Ipomoea triloba]
MGFGMSWQIRCVPYIENMVSIYKRLDAAFVANVSLSLSSAAGRSLEQSQHVNSFANFSVFLSFSTSLTSHFLLKSNEMLVAVCKYYVIVWRDVIVWRLNHKLNSRI